MVFQCLSCFSFPLHQLDLIWIFGAGWSSWLYQFLPFDHSGLPAVSWLQELFYQLCLLLIVVSWFEELFCLLFRLLIVFLPFFLLLSTIVFPSCLSLRFLPRMFSLVPYISFALAQQNLKIWGSGCAFAPGRDLALAGEETLTAGADGSGGISCEQGRRGSGGLFPGPRRSFNAQCTCSLINVMFSSILCI